LPLGGIAKAARGAPVRWCNDGGPTAAYAKRRSQAALSEWPCRYFSPIGTTAACGPSYLSPVLGPFRLGRLNAQRRPSGIWSPGGVGL